jgi:hypothetical protein
MKTFSVENFSSLLKKEKRSLVGYRFFSSAAGKKICFA